MKSQERALKWTQRADDWARLADLAREDWVEKTCANFAGWCYDMSEFFGGVQ